MEILSTPEYAPLGKHGVLDGGAHRGRPVGFRRIGRNITERRQMQDQVRALAFHDPLTGLPNRRLLADRLGHALAASKRSGTHGAVLFLDLDHFKPLNDLHGHAAGDLLLIEAAKRLRTCVREMDTVARFGGDEFVVVLGTLHAAYDESRSLAMAVAEKVSAALARPYQLTLPRNDGGTLSFEHSCTSSIGGTLFFGGETGAEDILKRADAAMYQAKHNGRDRIHFS